MMNKSKLTRLLSLSLAAVGFGLLAGSFSTVNAQNDPFYKPTWAKPRTTTSPTTTSSQIKSEKPKAPVAPPVIVVSAPPIESRIAYYKNLRESAAVNGLEIPKVTSVLTLDEMAITGIFRTPRGYAAMVEAKPIKLSYTIYPGEKFFDGQLVAIEENRVVFRKVTKMSNNKFVSSVENKALRQYSVEQEVQGTAPVQPTVKTEEPTQTALVPKDSPQPAVIVPAAIVSPIDEMSRLPVTQPEETSEQKSGKKGKKRVKVADNKNP